MTDQRRLMDKIKFWGGVVTAIVVIVSTIGTVYSWYYVGSDTCKKVVVIEKDVSDLKEFKVKQGEKNDKWEKSLVIIESDIKTILRTMPRR